MSPQRGIELNKHLLGRAPLSQAEMSAHISLLASAGHDAVIDSIIDSAEYIEVFGMKQFHILVPLLLPQEFLPVVSLL